jgi:hypothetical protein
MTHLFGEAGREHLRDLLLNNDPLTVMDTMQTNYGQADGMSLYSILGCRSIKSRLSIVGRVSYSTLQSPPATRDQDAYTFNGTRTTFQHGRRRVSTTSESNVHIDAMSRVVP